MVLTEWVFDLGALGNMFLGGLFLYAGKLAWQRFGSKANRVSEDLCGKNQEACRSKLLTQWFDYKLEMKKELAGQNSQLSMVDANFDNLGLRLDRTNSLLKAILGIQMEFCRTAREIDCDELTHILVQQGIEVGALSFRKKNPAPG